MEKSKEYLEVIKLIRNNEGEKFIYKKLKRFIAAKKISIAEYVELSNFFEDKETADFSAFDNNNDIDKEPLESILKIKDNEIETMTELLRFMKFKHNNNLEELEKIIQRTVLSLFFSLTLSKKEAKRGDLAKHIKNLSYFDINNIKWLCKNALYFCKDLITEEEHNFYIKRLIEYIQKKEEDTFNDIRKKSTISKYHFMTQDTILRDFEFFCEEKFYGIKNDWDSEEEIAGAFNEPNYFKHESDWDLLKEGIDTLKDNYEDLLKQFDNHSNSVKTLKNIAKKYYEIIKEEIAKIK